MRQITVGRPMERQTDRRDPFARAERAVFDIAARLAERLPWPRRARVRVERLLAPRLVVAAVGVIPERDGSGRVLVMQARYSGRWILPGGGVHPGEDPLTGLRRECREELGVDVEVRRLVGVCGVPWGEFFAVFDCAPLPARPRLSAEHTAWRYLPPDELPDFLRLILEWAAAGPHPSAG